MSAAVQGSKEQIATQKSRYEILAEIATGGMATVYVGRLRGASGFSRLVAIKRAHPFVTADKELVRTLEQEARLASLLRHPNVVSVLDVEELAGELCLVLEYVEGCSARELDRGVKTRSREFYRAAIRIALDAAEGLHAAHLAKDEAGVTLGLVHRDVSPHNVLVGVDGVARLTDFGIARGTSAENAQTSTGILKGKLGYMAPEYLERHVFDARSDLFSLGIVTWELLAGKSLFQSANELDTIQRITRTRVPLLSELDPNLAPLDPILARALAQDPESRYPSVSEFAEALEIAARAHDLVGSRADVSGFVDAVVGEKLSQRRAALVGASPRTVVEMERERKAAFARDDVATASLPAPVAMDEAATKALPRPDVNSPPRLRWVIVATLVIVLAGATFAISSVKSGIPEPIAPTIESSAGASSELPPATVETRTTASSVAAIVSAAPSASARPRVEPRISHGARVVPASSVHHPIIPKRAPPNPYEH